MDLNTVFSRARTAHSIKRDNQCGKRIYAKPYSVKRLLSRDELTFIFMLFS